MAFTFSLRRWKRRTPCVVGPRLRRAVLLGSLAASLVLIGDQTFVGALGRSAPQAPSLALGLQPNLAMVLAFAVNIHQSIGSMSAWSFEVVSLVVMGLCLLGGGRALARERRGQQFDRNTLAHAARPAEVLSLTARAEAAPLVQVPQRVAR